MGRHDGCIRSSARGRASCPSLVPLGAALAQTKITVGKIIGGIGLHIPSYIAMDKGFFKDEGLDARFVELAGRPLVTAGLTGNSTSCRSRPAARRRCSRAAPRSATWSASRSSRNGSSSPGRTSRRPRTSRARRWATPASAPPTTTRARPCSTRFFKMEVGRDYKVISFQGEPERIAALVNGDIDARAGLGAARLPGQAGRHEGAAAHRRLPPARRRHVLDAPTTTSRRTRRR